jgi:glutamate-ammonia-ligase adenylyltransferase
MASTPSTPTSACVNGATSVETHRGPAGDSMRMNPVDRLPDFMQADAEAKVNRLREACRDAGVALPDDPDFHRELAAVLAFSDFVAERCARHPRLLADLTDSGDLQRTSGAGECAARLSRALEGVTEAADLSFRLRGFRRREMVRIAWRDLAGLADLAETTADLSDLAEACLDQALAWLWASSGPASSTSPRTST